MFYDLIATVSAAFGGAGLALLARWLSGGRAPRWLTPAAAAAAMMAFQIWSQYSWYPRTAGALPEGVEVLRGVEEAAMWRPWSYVAPQVVRFSAVNSGGARRHPDHPGQVIADVLLFARFAPPARAPVLVDCAGRRRASLADGAAFGADGAVLDPSWTPLPPDDPLLGALCGDGTGGGTS